MIASIDLSALTARAVQENVEFVSAIDDLDRLVYQQEDIFRITGAPLRSLRLAFLQKSFSYHYYACEAFRRYCLGAGVAPADLRTYEDLALIPLLPTSLFKKKNIVSVPEAQIAKVCLSSGTQGGRSRVYRDQHSLERLLGSVRQSISLLDEVERNRRVFVLGPDTEEARDLWFSYVLSIVDFLYPTGFYVRDDSFRAEVLLHDLARIDPRCQPLLVGPPFLFLDLVEAVRRSGNRLDLSRKDCLVVTAGGWKRHQQNALSRDKFNALMVENLGVAPGNVRDAFNMVELNTVLFECETGRKHVPPWLFASARDSVTLAVLPPDEEGLLAYCDPLATSYPCFILTDDIGCVSRDELCKCGRFGNTVTISRRVARVEARGCALKMDRAMSSVTAV